MNEQGFENILEMEGITKRFAGIVANDSVTLKVRRGEIHALSGENGAGKSTLMSILFGLYEPDEGVIKINGKTVNIHDPNDANKYRIGMVHQHFKLVPTFTALQNILLGAEPVKYGFLDLKESLSTLEELVKKYNFSIDLNRKISDMTVGMQQRVEILKMLYRDNDILIFDEPTAVLTPQEVEELMDILRNLKKEGKTILFISHKLGEVKEISDRCTVLWKGHCIGTVDTAVTSEEQISEMMVGRKVQFVPERKEKKVGEDILTLKNVCVRDAAGMKQAVKNASFTVRGGEIVCIAGIDGNGQTELAHAIAGLLPVESGELLFAGENWNQKGIRYRNTHGLAHIPEDRHKHGLVLDYSLEENLVIKKYFEPEFQNHGVIKKKAIHAFAEDLIRRFDIRVGDKGPATQARSMSGGNQQKAIIAREIDVKPRLLVAVQPTRGLDVGAIEYVHKHLLEMRDAGAAVLLISLELDEILNVSDRILVMYNGELVCNLDAEKTTAQELGLYMMGVRREEVS